MSRQSFPARSPSREGTPQRSPARVTFDEEKIRRDRKRAEGEGGSEKERIPLKENPQTPGGKGNHKGGGKGKEDLKKPSPNLGYWAKKAKKRRGRDAIRERSPTPHPSGVRQVSLENK